MFTKDFIHHSIRSCLYRELNLATKPGLVCPNSNGCHLDMNYALMSKSIECISKSFYEFIEIGMNHSLDSCLEIARPYAIHLEQEMLTETNFVNTHKGAIYLFALTNLSLGYAFQHHLSWEDFLFNFEILNQNDYDLLLQVKEPKTYGQKIYKQYGLTGIIGEVHHRFHSIIEYSLPLLEQGYSDEILLLSLIAYSSDTCILHHNTIDTFHSIQQQAHSILILGINHSPSFEQSYNEFCSYCNTHHISCGGSADLLALTFYFDILKKSFF